MSFTTEEFPSTSYYKRDLREIIDYCRKFQQQLDNYAEIIETLSEAISDIDEMKTDIASLQSATSDLNSIRSNVSSLNTKLASLEQEVENISIDMDAVYDYINQQISLTKEIIVNLDAKLSSAIRLVSFETAFEIEKLKLLVNRQYAELQEELQRIVPTSVYNRVAGIELTLDENNFNVYEDLRCGGITNAELSEYGISNNYIASIILDNRDYAINLRKRLKLHYMFSPVTGRKVSHSNAMSQVIALMSSNNHVGSTNQSLYEKMLEDSKTNDDISDYYTSNFGKYFWLVG